MAVATGKAYWASVQAPNTTFDPVYSIDLVVDSTTAKRLNGEGLKVKKGDDGELIVKFKRKAFKKDGSPMSPPKVVDSKKQPSSELIGNGSEVNVSYEVFDWSFGGKSGKSAWLNAVQIIDLVPYEQAGGDEFDEVDGFAGGDSSVNEFDSSDDDMPFDD